MKMIAVELWIACDVLAGAGSPTHVQQRLKRQNGPSSCSVWTCCLDPWDASGLHGCLVTANTSTKVFCVISIVVALSVDSKVDKVEMATCRKWFVATDSIVGLLSAAMPREGVGVIISVVISSAVRS